MGLGACFSVSVSSFCLTVTAKALSCVCVVSTDHPHRTKDRNGRASNRIFFCITRGTVEGIAVKRLCHRCARARRPLGGSSSLEPPLACLRRPLAYAGAPISPILHRSPAFSRRGDELAGIDVANAHRLSFPPADRYGPWPPSSGAGALVML